ncbi:MAG: PAS domain S-box protein [Desulfarculaceae bacterium]
MPAQAVKRQLGAILPAFLSVVLFGATVFWFILPRTESAILAKKREMICELTKTAWGILDSYDQQVRAGILPLSEAQARAASRIQSLRYGPEGKDYFWINDLTPRMIMHPYRNDLEGKDLSDYQDPKGKRLFVEFVRVVKASGGGYVSYHWQWKDDPTRILPKISYVKGFMPWGWIIGTGIYFEDVQAEMSSMIHNLTIVGLIVLVLVTFMSGYLTFRELKAQRQKAASVEELRETVQKLNAVLQASPDPMVVYNREGEATYINPAFTRVFGWEPEEVQGDRIDFVPPENIHETIEGIRRLYADENDFTPLESRRITKKGEIIDVSVQAALFRNPDGAPEGMVVSLTNITERKKAELTLKESEERHRLFLERLPEPVLAQDMTGKTIYLNSAFEKTFGWSREELLGKNPDFIPHGEQDRTQELLAAMQEGQPPVILETKRLTKDRRLLDVHLDSSPFFDHQGRQVGNISILRNVTELRQALIGLRESEERNRAILEASADPMVAYDREGRVIFFNPAFTRVFGWSLDEKLGYKMDEFVPQDCWPQTNALIKKIMAGESFFAVESRRFTKEGKIIPVSLSGSVIRDPEGNPVGSIVNLRDISETKRLEAQLLHAQKMEAIGTLAGGVAHDFNNILQAISGYAQLLAEPDARDQFHEEYVSQISQAAERASSLVQRLLTFSRRVEPELKPVDLNREVGESVKILGRTIPKMITIETKLSPDLKTISGDATQLEQVLLNIGGNAAEAMPDGGKIKIETENIAVDGQYSQQHPGMEPGDYVKLTITDNGQGMDPSVVKKIFDPFFTTKEVGKGTGLGLAIVYGIIKTHSGYINCYSTLGIGTVFNIYLPALQEAMTSDSQPPRKKVELKGGHETILVVDDEKVILKMAQEMLKRRGYRVFRAMSGEEALELYRDNPGVFDLVILDLSMPGMGGRKALAELLKIDAKAKVIISSGYAADGQAQAAVDMGAQGFIGKPYRLAEMLTKIREVLDLS